jgi:hypothetical protein
MLPKTGVIIGWMDKKISCSFILFFVVDVLTSTVIRCFFLLSNNNNNGIKEERNVKRNMTIRNQRVTVIKTDAIATKDESVTR